MCVWDADAIATLLTGRAMVVVYAVTGGIHFDLLNGTTRIPVLFIFMGKID